MLVQLGLFDQKTYQGSRGEHAGNKFCIVSGFIDENHINSIKLGMDNLVWKLSEKEQEIRAGLDHWGYYKHLPFTYYKLVPQHQEYVRKTVPKLFSPLHVQVEEFTRQKFNYLKAYYFLSSNYRLNIKDFVTEKRRMAFVVIGGEINGTFQCGDDPPEEVNQLLYFMMKKNKGKKKNELVRHHFDMKSGWLACFDSAEDLLSFGIGETMIPSKNPMLLLVFHN